MNDKDFVTYEYRTETVKPERQSQAADLYEAFGWEISDVSRTPLGEVNLSLKRDRKQKHKQELNKLERRAESVFSAIDGLERSKTAGARLFAIPFGIAGTLVFGGGLSLAMLIEGIPALVGGIALGVLGLALCGAALPLYRKIAAAKTKKVLPLIEENEEKLADLLEQGDGLLKADLI